MQDLYLHTGQHNTEKTRTYIHASSGIRTHDPRVRAAEDSTCLRSLGRWDWLTFLFGAKVESCICVYLEIYCLYFSQVLRVMIGEKNSPTVAHACRKRRLKWVVGAWGYNWATQSPEGYKYGDLVLQVGGWEWG
jgi:hypothetical protein